MSKVEKWLVDEARKVGLDIEGFEHEITVVRQNGKTDLSNAKIITGEEAIPPARSCKHARRQPNGLHLDT